MNQAKPSPKQLNERKPSDAGEFEGREIRRSLNLKIERCSVSIQSPFEEESSCHLEERDIACLSRERRLRVEDHYIEVEGHYLHMVRVYEDPEGEPVILLHGAISNHSTFINKRADRGLAATLAKRGYDVFILNQRGHGNGFPKIKSNSPFGLKELLKEELPAYLQQIQDIKGRMPHHWMGHSWGGVMLLAYYARYHEGPEVKSITLFGTRRQSTVRCIEKRVIIDFLLHRVAWVAGKIFGYIPLKRFGFSENETCKWHREIMQWLHQPEWLDWEGDYDYAQALREKTLPRILSLTGTKDLNYGHPQDARLFLQEIGLDPNALRIVGKAHGHTHDYTHENILTHPEAEEDYFHEVMTFIQEASEE